jgi:hypothetical protein
MGATSVTGVGQGSVEGSNMGSKHWTVGVGRLLGPRVMVADEVTLSGGAATVKLPLLSGVVGDYIVVATDKTAAAAVKAVLTFNANDTTITFAGTSSDVIQYAIVKKGLAL